MGSGPEEILSYRVVQLELRGVVSCPLSEVNFVLVSQQNSRCLELKAVSFGGEFLLALYYSVHCVEVVR